MDVSVRELRYEADRVIAAVEAGTLVTLTVHGRPVADIVPRQQRHERRASEVVWRELDELRNLADSLGLRGKTNLDDFDPGLSSDDFFR